MFGGVFTVVGYDYVSIVGLGATPRGISCTEARFMLHKLRCLACMFCIFLSLIPISYLLLTRADSPGGASPIKELAKEHYPQSYSYAA